MLNNGFSLVLFTLCYGLMTGDIVDSNIAVIGFIRAVIGGPILGAGFGLSACWWLRRVIRDDVLTISVMLLTSYLLFFVCEYTWLQFSGFLALTVLGLLMANVG